MPNGNERIPGICDVDVLFFDEILELFYHGAIERTGESFVRGHEHERRALYFARAKKFGKLDIQLVVRATDFNRFQEKLRKGAVQLYFLGWNADYPDPENFFFLLAGAESKVAHGGENTSNYASPEFDRLFAEMKDMDSGQQRLAIISRMNRLLQQDAPWIFGFHPTSYTLGHAWLHNRKPTDVGNNSLKYQRIDVALREAQRRAWNEPVLWPLAVGVLVLLSVVLPAFVSYRRRERGTARS